MLKKIGVIAGIFIVGIASFILLNQPLEVDTAVVNKDFVAKEKLHNTTLEILKVKLHEKYVGVDVKTTPKKELVIQVVGDPYPFFTIMIVSLIFVVILIRLLKRKNKK